MSPIPNTSQSTELQTQALTSGPPATAAALLPDPGIAPNTAQHRFQPLAQVGNSDSSRVQLGMEMHMGKCLRKTYFSLHTEASTDPGRIWWPKDPPTTQGQGQPANEGRRVLQAAEVGPSLSPGPGEGPGGPLFSYRPIQLLVPHLCSL
jgi:hypothetical protein